MKQFIILAIIILFNQQVFTQWTLQNSNTQADLNAVFFIDDQVGWIACDDGNILKTNNGGQNWISFPVSPINEIRDVHFISTDLGFATSQTKIFKSNSGGATWTELAIFPDYSLSNIYFLNDSMGFILCYPRRILKTTDSGNSWTEIIVDSNFTFNGIYFKNETIGWASVHEGVTYIGSIFKTIDGGETWEKIHLNYYLLNSISGFPDSDTLFCCGVEVLHGVYRVLLSSQDGGETWFTVPSPINTYLFYFSTPNIGRIYGHFGMSIFDNKIIHTDNGGNTWITEDSTYLELLLDWFFVNDDVGWAVGYEGLIKHLNNVSNVNHQTSIITDFNLFQNYPNPFNPVTTIKYQIPETGIVTIKVYDVLGNEIETLISEEKPVGSFEVEFDATGLPSGIYFYRFQAGSFVETKKMVLLQ